MLRTATLIFGAGFLASTSKELDPNTWILVASALFLLCLGLFLLEFFIPSLGLIMVLATLCSAGSIWSAFQAGTVPGWVFVMLNVTGIPSIVVVGFKVMKRSSMVLRDEITGTIIDDDQAAALEALIGQRGPALSMLRPTGTARIADRTLSVQTRGEFIEKGEAVEVTAVESNLIYVKAARD